MSPRAAEYLKIRAEAMALCHAQAKAAGRVRRRCRQLAGGTLLLATAQSGFAAAAMADPWWPAAMSSLFLLGCAWLDCAQGEKAHAKHMQSRQELMETVTEADRVLRAEGELD